MIHRGGCCCRTVTPTMLFPVVPNTSETGTAIIAIAILILVALAVIF